MTPSEACQVLGVDLDAPWDTVRASYRELIRTHHPDVAGNDRTDRALLVIEAYRTLSKWSGSGRSETVPPGDEPDVGPVADPVGTDEIVRVDADTIAFGAPADETFRLILDAVHDVGAVTYLDRSVPIVEVLCRFVGEPATSLVITLQGRMDRTEAFCTAESIENRPGPPASAVVDLLEDAVRLRAGGQASGP